MHHQHQGWRGLSREVPSSRVYTSEDLPAIGAPAVPCVREGLLDGFPHIEAAAMHIDQVRARPQVIRVHCRLELLPSFALLQNAPGGPG
jgi:hypothetical protein